MDHSILQDYLNQNTFPVITKKRKSYLTYEGLKDCHAYILKNGIIKTSIISHDGREFNLRYIKDLEIVSLLRDEYSQFTDYPFNIRIESETAELYKIDRVKFWQDINKSKDLQMYVKDYYRVCLLTSIKKMQQMLMNGKFGAVCTQIFELYELFGIPMDNGYLIDFIITNEEIAHFCGITSASSVNRMFQQLKDMDAIQIRDRKIFIKNLDTILDYVIK
ncbi:Crp/Fnr family transcriptional regulator [Vagococcus sp.]|uniref:Crp/Fnr family transcriptional regulator n=1 Tax=Vagococcus sp. TaxID=1933889 RepID=UPI003F990332